MGATEQSYSKKVILPFVSLLVFPTTGSIWNIYRDLSTWDMYYWDNISMQYVKINSIQQIKTRHIEQLFTWDTIELLHTPVFIYSVSVNWVIYYEWIDRDLVWSDIVFSTFIWANDTVEVVYEY